MYQVFQGGESKENYGGIFIIPMLAQKESLWGSDQVTEVWHIALFWVSLW